MFFFLYFVCFVSYMSRIDAKLIVLRMLWYYASIASFFFIKIGIPLHLFDQEFDCIYWL